ncbi:MAG: hypothetical protein A3H96_08320 [Acidobacteria bacterium RIFCSPLOWO2_02_FULL_67_36]|nr:MAG: hypothetical protein A3H96_08320 [Acidobacteria bacterium RIFCSPLOWO2_02_FULL_67_36]OFW24666.1 MAG: hypothetical protein A3G21_17115 [Acidobacteria bacterium RIFCSPLOWO2_12_FULL_66_21]
MTWWLRLYPRRWRERYGAEMAALVAARPLSPAVIVDLIAGAIDARVHPQQIRRHQKQRTEEDVMLSRLMRRCAAGPNLSPSEQRLANGVLVGFTLAFALLYVAAAWRFKGSELVDALGIMAFPAALVCAMPFSYLKGHSRLSQFVVVGGTLALLAVCSWLAASI